MIINIIILIIGFIVLIKGADLFVDAASSMASHFHISKMIIALTIVAFGTSAPELAVSIKSMLNGSGDIVLGNVIGSNILNILLILGNREIIIASNQFQNSSKWKQEQFDYQGNENVLVGQTKNNCFTPKRVQVFQMYETDESRK